MERLFMKEVVYFVMLKRRSFTSWEGLAKSYSRDFIVLKERLQNFPLVEILGQEETYGTMSLKSSQHVVEQMYSIKLIYDPRKEPLGKSFPESTTLLDRTWHVEGEIKIPVELSDLVDEVVIR